MIIALIKKVIDKSINIEHWKLIIAGLAFIIVSSFIIVWIEPNEFKTPLNGFWFVMTTISQVGFGDYIPKTTGGRFYTVVLYVVGVGFFAIIIAKWIDLLNNYEVTKEKEMLGFKGTNHIVMTSWSEKTKQTIEEILAKNPSVQIVLIDQMTQSPTDKKNVHYVQGDATKTETLQRANIIYAETVCIFAPDNVIDKSAEDGKILLTASKIKQMAKDAKRDIYMIVEILDEDHVSTTNKEHIDEFIISDKPFSTLMATKAIRNYS